MKSIDSEIFQVEQRLHMREAAIKREASQLKARGARALMSPVTIVAAVALGFVAAGTAARRKARAPLQYRDRRKQPKEQSKRFALGGLLMTAATWYIKNQFGGPVGLARYVVSKVRKNEAQPRSLRAGA
jgi:hypothetical protein